MRKFLHIFPNCDILNSWHTTSIKKFTTNRRRFTAPGPPRKGAGFGEHFLTAAVFAAYALFVLIRLIVGRDSAYRSDVIRIVGVPLLCLLAVSVLRNLIDRRRPYEREDIDPILNKKKAGHSFPSRHVASAFVIGVVLLRYAVWAGVLVLLAGILLGYIRFAAGLHYPSDLFAGAAFGVLFGLIAFI